jgi:hypothetical protein
MHKFILFNRPKDVQRLGEDVVSGDEHSSSRQKFKNSVRKKDFNKKLI